MRRRPVAGRAAGLALAAALAGCASWPSVGPDYPGAPVTRSLAQADAAAAAPADAAARGALEPFERWQAPLPHGGSGADLARWWAQFDDPTLDALLEAAQRESATLAQAAARIEQARAASTAARAAGLPAVDADLSFSRGTISTGTSVITASTTRATLPASWELDLFGRIRREREAAEARLAASDAQWHEARVSIAAETAARYLQLRYCELQMQIVRADGASRAETATISARAAEAGFQSPAAAALTRASAAEGAARLTAQLAECDAIVKGLVSLSGLSEPDLRARLAATAGRLPQPKDFEVAVLPASLLMQRPDLAAAERELAAASADIGAAEGDRYPRLALLGSIGPLRLDFGGGGTTLNTWSIGPALSVPLFDGGRRAANVDAARAAYAAAEAAYRERVRRAVREVEEALVLLASANGRDADARAASQGYRQALEAAQVRWRTGLGSLIELEEVRRLALVADSTLAAVQRDRVAAWVALYRALGGGWTNG
jgi:NodT family efflux transporter outer membrane factor (OMF) lipoprotein